MDGTGRRRAFVVGIGGTTKPRSSSEKALACAEQEGAETRLLNGHFLATLPIYDSEVTDRSDAQRELVETVRRADGVLIATPAYHAGISGMVKNSLDHLEDLRTDERPYLDGRAVGSIITALDLQGGGATLTSVRTIIHALRGWPTPVGVTLNTEGRLFDESGACIDAKSSAQLLLVAQQVVGFCCQRY
jgi:FMN reductase